MIERRDLETRLHALREREARAIQLGKDGRVQALLLSAQIEECEFWLFEVAKREEKQPCVSSMS
jgi:hypothetical protein